MQLSRPTVNQAVSRLEQHLGRANAASEHPQAQPDRGRCADAAGFQGGIDLIAAAQLEISASQLRPSGRLRITAPVAFGVMHIAPLLAEFGRR